MKFDFKLIVGAIFCFVGMLLPLFTFTLDKNPWWVNTVYAVVCVLWLGFAESIATWITGIED